MMNSTNKQQTQQQQQQQQQHQFFGKQLDNMSVDDLIKLLENDSLSNISFERKSRKDRRKATRKLRKRVTIRTRKVSLSVPKWRSVEPTSNLVGLETMYPDISLDVIPDVHDDFPFVPVIPPYVPPYYDMIDFMENAILNLTPYGSLARQRLLMCLDFDTPLDISSCIRIPTHQLRFIAQVLGCMIEEYKPIMPDHYYQSIARRHIEMLAAFHAKEEVKRKRVRWRCLKRFCKYFEKFMFRLTFEYIFDNRMFPLGAEPTSRVTSALSGVAASIFAGYSFYQAGSGDDDPTGRFIMNWAMQGVSVIKSGRLVDWILWVLSFINIFTPLTSIAVDAFQMIERLLGRITNPLRSQQQQQGRAVEPTSMTEVLSMVTGSFSGFATNTTTIATVLSVFAVLVGSLLLGVNLKDVANADGIALKLVKSGTAISKGKTGLYAILTMIGDLKGWIETALASMSLIKLDDTFSKSILSCDIDDTSSLKKNEIFSYIDYLINPENFLTINRSHDEQLKLTWTHSVLSRVLENNAKKPILNPSAVQLLVKQIGELNKVRATVFRYVKDEDTRFVPFWINIYGLAGTRKSTFMSKLAKTLVEALRRLGKYEVSGSDNIFSVNFTDKYMTGYKQQMCVLIDDIFQDATPLGDRSSALDIISWVSNIPHHTNQAALDEKGLPFTSKIIISTSNVPPSALSRKEIICDDALKRRMKCAVEFEKDSSAPVDPMLGERLRIYRLDPLGQVTDRIPIENAQTLCSMILREYIKWYDLQQDLIKSGGADDVCVKQMLQDLDPAGKIIKNGPELSSFTPMDNPDPLPWFVAKKNEDVQPTSLIEYWSSIVEAVKGTPRIIKVKGVDQFDVRYHANMEGFNTTYRNYIAMATFSGDTVKPILEFYKEFTERQKDLHDAQEQLRNGKNWLDKTLDFIKSRPLWQYLGLALGSIVTYKWFTSESKPEATAIQYDYGKPIRQPPKVAKVVVPTSGVMDAYKEDFTITGTDANAMELVLSTLIGKGGIARIIVPREDNRCETAVVVRIGGTCILANHHVFAKFQENQDFTIEIPHYINAMKKVNQKFQSKNLIKLGNSDACVYRCDYSMPAGKNLTRHFIGENVKIKSTSAVIATRNPEAMYVSNVIATPVTRPLSYTDETGKQEYTTLGCFEVNNYVTTKGMSGSLLVALDPYNPKKLLGIQTSRNVHTKAGYFCPITEKMLVDAITQLGDTLDANIVDREFIAEACSVVFDEKCPPNLGHGSLIYIGTIEKSDRIQTQTKTKIEPSKIHDEDTLTKAPAVLSKYDPRLSEQAYGKDLLFSNMTGYDEANYGGLNLNLLDEVTEMIATEYSCIRSVAGVQRRLLTDDEMVNGIQGLINPIDMNTSPGYPWIKQRKLTGTNGKFEWFESTTEDNGRNLYKPVSILKDRIDLRENAARNGMRVESISYACLKDETRPLKKIEDGVTRVFICLPMDYNLLIRKYFGTYIATQHVLAGKISSSVGIDPTTGWKALFDRLRSKGDQWEDFDYKNWDQFLHPEFIKRYAQIVNRWYGDADNSENGKVRFTLMHELVYNYLLVGSRMFVKTGGQSSGCAITAEINCDIHDLIMFYVFCVIAEENGDKITKEDRQNMLAFYRNNNALALYGDDIVKSSTPTVLEWFNGNTIAGKMAQIGMKITPGDKEAKDFIIKKPEQITFLKRGFKPDVKYPDRFVRAPLDVKTIWNIPQWIKSCDDKQEATRVNSEMALREMYMYGETDFNNARDYLNKRIALYNMCNPGAEIRPLTLTYSGLQSAYEEGNLEICFPKGWRDFQGEIFVQ